MPIAVLILVLVFLAIAFRQVGARPIPIWAILSAGAAGVLLTGEITPLQALTAINVDVLLFLFGMFVVGQALEDSGYLSHLSYKFFSRARSTGQMLWLILFGMGLGSAFLMNDTLAIIGTPVVLHLARSHRVSPKLLLLALAFAVTLGSVMSPIGNPQNLLIAVDGKIANPFVTFLKFLFLPTLLSLAIVYPILKFFYKDQFHDHPLDHTREPIRDAHLARLCKISLGLILLLISIKIGLAVFNTGRDFPMTAIALTAALPPLLASPRRWPLLRGIDWHTLVFFAAMFVLMASVWQSGFLQNLIAQSRLDLTSNSMILCLGILFSQVISNVPFVALYLPLLTSVDASPENLMALAAGSTIAGNLLILGAASNVIIIQNAEKKWGETISFMEFARVGIPLTAASAVVYGLFLI